MEKLTEQVSIRLPWDEFRQLAGLADLHSASISEYIRGVVMDHLQIKRSQFERMRDVFASAENPAPAPKDQP
jgi:hypothetical protein